MRFTEVGVERLRPKKSRFMQTEGDGLYLQVLPGGTKKWLHFYRDGAKQQWFNLGYYPEMGVAEARKRNQETARLVAETTTKQSLNFNSKFEDVFKDWHGKAVDRRGKPWSAAHKRNVEYMFKADVTPALGDMRMRDIRKRDIRELLEAVEERAPGQALQVYRRLSRLFNYAASKDIIEASPMAALDPIGTSKPKDRYLNDKEIKIFLESLPKADMAENTAHAIELVLRTGQRPSEVCGATASEIDAKELWWVIPSSRTKNGLEHRVPITKKILALFGTANKHGLFFPALRRPDTPITHTVLSKALRRSLTGEEKKDDKQITIPLAPFSPHDCRRSCATGLQSLGFGGEIIGSLLNHKKEGVTGQHYMMHDYSAEKRTAIVSWEHRLGSILTGVAGKVLPMTKGRRKAS